MSDQPQDPNTEPQPEPTPPPEPQPEPMSCGICGAQAVETFPGFGDAPDVHFCMACGAWKEGEGEWVDPFAW